MKPETITTLEIYNLKFEPNPSIYGLLGYLKTTPHLSTHSAICSTVAVICAKTFYIHDDEFPLNKSTLAAIADIQSVYGKG